MFQVFFRTTLRLFIFSALWFPLAATAQIPQSTAALSDRIVSCYNKGNVTVRRMHVCSGAWVSPKALMSCVMQASCPALPGRYDLQASFEAALRLEGLTLDSNLLLSEKNLPKLPDANVIASCKRTTTTVEAFTTCALPSTITGAQQELIKCVSGAATNEAKAKCLIDRSSPDAQKLYGCAGNAQTPEQLARCIGGEPLEKQVATAKTCVAAASDSKLALSCVAGPIGGDAPRVAACLTSQDKKQVVICLLGNNPEAAKAQKVYACASSAKDTAALHRLIAPRSQGTC